MATRWCCVLVVVAEPRHCARRLAPPASTAFRSTGRRRAPGRQTLILVHGWTCDDSVVGRAGAGARQVEVPRAHARPARPRQERQARGGATFSMDLFARAVEAVRGRGRSVDRLVLVGHSMGTPVDPAVRAAVSPARGRPRDRGWRRSCSARRRARACSRRRRRCRSHARPRRPEEPRDDDPRHVHAGDAATAAGARPEDDAGGAGSHGLRRDGGDLRSRRSGKTT